MAEGSVRNYFRHRMTTFAAALAYRALFGVLPLMVLVVVLLGLLRFDAFFRALVEGAEPAPPPQILETSDPAIERGRRQAEPAERLVEQARNQAGGGLLSFGAAAGLWSVHALARTLVEALNAAHQVPETRPGWKRGLLSLAFGPFLVVAVIAATALMLIGSRLIERLADPFGLDEVFVALWAWLRFPVALLVLAAVISVVYHIGPDIRGGYRLATPGAALAALAWAITSLGFSVYLATFADYGAIYGSLGAAVGLIFYLYLSASVILFGAEVNAVILRGLGWAKKGQK